MKDIAKTLIDQHKGKTVTISISSVLLGLWVATELGYAPPLPATRDYVREHVAQATKGLPYLVKKEIERDVDLVLYDVQCMREYQKQGTLDRVIREFEDLVGEPYVRKTCEDLEQRFRAAAARF